MINGPRPNPLAGLQFAPMAQPVATQAQIEEAKQIRAMQLRTNAVQFAIAMLGGREGDTNAIIAAAMTLVEYLEKG